MKIFNKITTHYHKELPFVVYRKPNKNTINGFFMQDDELFFIDDFSESGFVFAPFDANEKAILFPLKKAAFIAEPIALQSIISNKKKFLVDEVSKDYHIQLVKKVIDEINTTDLKKVVISRKEEIHISDFNILEVYQKLLENYKNAFVYAWFHPKVGLWLGATPETLLHIENSVFKTMSLAGTQVYQGDSELKSSQIKNVVWKNKELDEQQLVTDFIKEQVKDISTNLKIDKTKTVQAGNLLHLKTLVRGSLDKKSTLKELIRALHPTPAVCGLPRNNAKKFILENENYNRSFYTGFLGEVQMYHQNIQLKNSSLFVNLRCMEIQNNRAFVYVGGGITKDSDAAREWEETVSKSKIMKKVL
ncbi:chorismate-binding protein [Polaribacter litorisediminis]|uniref:chorismate-binding protein n=1 Tax=Polaribacter litorisediminis TaxID=1908341 RepID=UPI001CC15147|nr:chorismate-binding protein [Polaribacter litorisediminis]UAM98943.1 chorismate-binding protein [Polaribacter litorisediminis]